MPLAPSYKPIYRADLFDPGNFTSIENIQAAIDEFEAIVSEKNAERLLSDLLQHEKPSVLPLVLSRVSSQCPMRSIVMQKFPSTASAYLQSFHSSLNAKLSEYLTFYADDFDLRTRLHHSYGTTQSGPAALNILINLRFPEEAGRRSPELARPKNQKARKKTNRATASTETVDRASFDVLGIPVPSNREDASRAETEIIGRLKESLEFFWDTLRISSSSIISNFVATPTRALQVHAQGSDLDERSPTSNINESTSSSVVEVPTPSIVYPMKSALYFDDIDDFGDWRIVINDTTNAVLRTAYKKERTKFEIILRKLRDLSHGHFSPDNQKMLEGLDSDLPVYEAKLSRDLRMIYQTDLLPYDAANDQMCNDSCEQQAIKIIDVCTHAQMDHRLRETIKRQLTRKGKEYRRRCGIRLRAGSGGDVYIPAVFPPLPDNSEELDVLPDLPFSNSKDLLTRYAMEKFVTLSQPLLNTIIADLQIVFPHLVSLQEKVIVEHPYSCYVLGRSGTGKTTTMLFKMLLIERGYVLAGRNTLRPRQLFVTQSRVLATKVQDYFLKLMNALKVSEWSPERMASHRDMLSSQGPFDRELLDLDDIADYQSNLPERFSDLEDEHFPVITTIDRLWSMLEADEINCDKRWTRRTLTYEIFLSEYWTHFPQSLIKRLDPALVFGEIMGVIKGSEETLKSGKGESLRLGAYMGLSDRNYSTFSEQREDIFAIFQSYSRRKTSLNDIDSADRTHSIIKSLVEAGGLRGKGIDYLYVDEVQDNLLIDTWVLRALCSNPNGLFWAGDTAQTISVGSSFRFNELKAFQHRLEEQQKKDFSQCREPELFQLAVNYRSHAGIVDCAHSVISLISTFWPDAIDKLRPERGVAEGTRPLFFSASGGDSKELEEFLFGDAGNPIEFGAQQCIIVRDECARIKLQQLVGNDIGLIMTIYESKGLEFNDVLIYNFFEDSTIDHSLWRVLLNAIDGEERDVCAPTFNPTRHTSVCVELKFLYVAITRARENLWIADRSQRADTMKMYWLNKKHVQMVSPGADLPRLGTSSTREEWTETGNRLFDNKRYRQARHCFNRASLPDREREANAYFLREEAQKMPAVSRIDHIARAQAFLAAAEEFDACGRFARVVDSKLQFFRIAGTCYEHAKETVHAAKAYVNAEMYERAIDLYASRAFFDEALALTKQSSETISPSLVSSVTKRARLHYCAKQDFLRARTLFDDDDDMLEYLADRGLSRPRATLLESFGRLFEAAEHHLEEGDILQALRLLLKDSHNKASAIRAAECICEGCWKLLSFSVIDSRSDMLGKLLDMSKALGDLSMGSNFWTEIIMFQTIADGAFMELRDLGNHFLQEKNFPAALLCLDHYFENPPSLQHISIDGLSSELHIFHEYVRLMKHMVFHRDPCNDPSVLKLFGIRKSSTGGLFEIPLGTFLHRPVLHASTASQDVVFLNSAKLYPLFCECLYSRLQKRMAMQETMIREARTMAPCLNFVLTADCPRVGCPNIHLDSVACINTYNARIGVHLQQFEVMQMGFDYTLEDSTRWYWIRRLYDALNPPVYSMGSLANLNLSNFINSRGLQIVKDWVRNVAYNLELSHAIPFLTNLIRTATIAFLWDEKASFYLYQGRYMARRDPYLRQGDCFVLYEVMQAIEGRHPKSLNGGVLSIRYIIDRSLPIDIGVLCDFLDNLCASFIASSRFHYSKGSLHQLTAPRSWVVRYMADVSKIANREAKVAVPFIQALAALLLQVYQYKQSEHLLFGRTRKLANLPAAVRNMYMTRICRCLCLLGYNGGYYLRGDILAGFKRLRELGLSQGFGFHHQYSAYVYAETWESLSRVVRRSLLDSDADEMVQLMEASKLLSHPHNIMGTRRVIYDTLENIPRCVLGEYLPIIRNVGMINSAPPLEDIDANEVDVFLPDAAQNIDDELPSEVPQFIEKITAPTEEEHYAATRIQRVYRDYRRRRANQLGTAVARHFSSVKDQVSGLTLSSKYRLLFLGLLPHILSYLDAMESEAFTFKDRTKKRLMAADPSEYEQLDEQLTRVITVIKKIRNFLKLLHPKSNLHSKSDVNSLRSVIEDVDRSVVGQLPFKVNETKQKDWELAMKGIATDPCLFRDSIVAILVSIDLFLGEADKLARVRTEASKQSQDGDKFGQIQESMSKLKIIRGSLTPGSGLHRKGDAVELINLCSQTGQLISHWMTFSLPESCLRQLETSLVIIRKMECAPKARELKESKQKPALNVEDIW